MPVNQTSGKSASDSNLTQSQLLIWTGQVLFPEVPLYNMALAFSLAGSIDVDHFQTAFQALAERSEVLRTVVKGVGGIPQQSVLDNVSATVEFLDWTGQPEKVEGLKSWCSDRSERNFDLAQPMYDSVLIKLATDRFVWYFNQHHLITDGWSVTLLYNQMAAMYAASVAGNLSEVPPLPTFSDYRDFEHQSSLANCDSKDGLYWQQKISQLPVPPRLYGYENDGLGTRSQRFSVNLGEERSEKLRALTAEPDIRAWTQHLSLFNIFATTLLAYLARVTSQQKLAIGTPAHNRITPDFKNTPGLFIELFPLVTDIDQEERFNSLFQKVQLEAFDFLRHAKPGAATAELSRGFNVVLNYINAAFSDFAGIPMHSDWVHPNNADASHTLRLQVHDFDATGSIQLHFDVNTDVLPETLHAQIPQHFLKLLDAFIEDRTGQIGAVPLETGQAIGEFLMDGIPNEEQKNVVGLFEERLNTAPQNGSLEFQETRLTFVEINAQANQLAHHLAQHGVEKGKQVAIHLHRSPELVVSVLAVLKTGATYIPIEANQAGSRAKSMMEDAEAAVLITSSALAQGIESSVGPEIIILDQHQDQIAQQPTSNLNAVIGADDLAYIMYTSGSTGKPKGVMIPHKALAHYISWAQQAYSINKQSVIPLFTAIGFDLTVTSLFLPLVAGATMVVYEEPQSGPDLSIFEVVKENKVSFIKLTPAHLALLQGKELPDSHITTMVVGGEELRYDVASVAQEYFGQDLRIFNEYGPTEATVGCIVHQFDAKQASKATVPIGQSIAGTHAYVLDDLLHQQPAGVAGELYVGGIGLAQGYWQQDGLTADQFIPNPFVAGERLYRTGDLVRMNQQGDLEYLGRKDEQVKIGGRRIELGEIENALGRFAGIDNCVIELRSNIARAQFEEVHNCVKCGLPSNYPNVSFNEHQVCGICDSFEGYQNRVSKYFKTPADFKQLFEQNASTEKEYDCIALLSGGKDSTYAMAKLVEMGLKVLAFTLDNGYISDQAKDNITRVATELGVDHMYGETPAMNDIFVDSLKRHCNVCDGCFKTIYTLSMQVALEKNIPYIVTGLSRGQFFETRLTEELFWNENADMAKIDKIILNARKSYHRVDDAVKKLLDVSAFEKEETFEKVQFLDYYRYTDVSLDEMLQYLDERVPWSRPTDTGRSTNCLINQAGIFVHKKERGYSNYAFPYSWDVRLGHKTRDASLEEINEEIDVKEVNTILDEIGYTQAIETAKEPEQLIGYYVSNGAVDEREVKAHLESLLPDYMVPSQLVVLDAMPLTPNGKVNKQALPMPGNVRPDTEVGYVAPRSDIEEMLTEIWSEVLSIEKIGVYDKFLELGGNSLAAIRIITRANQALELDLPVNLAFNKPTIAAFSEFVRETIVQLLEKMDEQ